MLHLLVSLLIVAGGMYLTYKILHGLFVPKKPPEPEHSAYTAEQFQPVTDFEVEVPETEDGRHEKLDKIYLWPGIQYPPQPIITADGITLYYARFNDKYYLSVSDFNKAKKLETDWASEYMYSLEYRLYEDTCARLNR